MPPTHTPYDGSSKPFTIGLKPLDLKDWIEIDGHFEAHLAEKERLYAAIPDLVFVEEPDTREAQREVLDLLTEHLTQRHPDRYRLSGDFVEIAGAGRQVTIGASSREPPLHIASMLVQEDLILMRKDADGWRLVAGSLCFPSSWSLAEKFGKPLHEIHDPVPAFGPGTRMAELINRMFDNLAADQPVQRWNWSLQANADLYHPLSHQQRTERSEKRPSKFAGEADFATAFIRVERQTLRKLPKSGDILFTIRIHLDPLAVLRKHPDRRHLASSFASQLSVLDTAQLDYKGLTADRDRLVERLGLMACKA
jgi:dimethylamine monooxygenase subunit A